MTDETREERWSRVAELLERAAAIPPEARPAFLDEACGTDTRLRSHLELLLAADERAEGFLSTPAQHPLHAALDAALVPDPQAGTRIGDCTIVRRVASGGMGSVYEAIQDQPRRKVALKLVHAGLASSATRQRFAYEAEILGRLRHPHIAQVYAAGTDAEGRAYLAMEFVEGARHLTQYVREHPLEPRALARLFCDVCSGVAHGHEKGVIHRDLKPSNVLVDALGQVKVIDFGVARVLDQDALQLTRTGDIVGTLLYMSPEQLEGDPRAVDVRSDVYALGTLLYELFTGRTPHEIRGLSITAAARRLRDETARPLRELAPHVGTELEWIVAKALEKDRDRRYASVNELAADLERFLANDPVLAGPPSATYRVRKFVRRHRVGVAAAAGFVVLLVGGLIAALVARAHALDLRARAQAAETESSQRALDLARELETNREILALQSRWITSSELEVTGRDVRLASVLDQAAEALSATPPKSPMVEVELRFALAHAYNKLNLWSESLEQVRALHAAIARGGNLDPPQLDDVDLLTAENELLTGEFDRALQRTERALAALESGVDPDGLRRAAWTLRRGDVLYRLHRFTEAEADLRAGVLSLERAGAALSSEAFDGRLSLCRTLRLAERLEEAHMESTKLLADAERVYRAGHLTISVVRQELAKELDELGRRPEAIEIYERELAEMDARLGPDAETTCLVAGELAWILVRDRHFERAEALSRRSYEGTLRLRGPDHVLTETRECRLGSILVRSGKTEEGLAHLRKVHAARSAALGPRALATIEVASQLGVELVRVRAYDEAVVLLRDVHAAYVEAHGHDHPQTLDSANSLGVVCYQLRRFDEAAEVLSDVLDTRTRLLGADHPLVFTSLMNVAGVLFQTGAYEESECLLRRLYQIFARGPYQNDFAKLPYPQLMGSLLLRREAYEEACAFLSPVLSALDHSPDASLALRADLIDKLARAQAGLGRNDLARETYAGLIADLAARLSPDDPVRLEGEFEHAAFLDSLGDAEQSLAVYESILARWKGGQDERRSMTRRLVELCRATGDAARAAEYEALEHSTGGN